MSIISVIVPVYMVEKYLCRCIDSILRQTFLDFELILVDDGSQDNCGAICDNYAKIDKRVHVIHQENRGLSAARNAGLDWMYANSCSEWITFIDSDDWVHERYLELLYDTATRFKTRITICDYKKTCGEALDVSHVLNVGIYNTEEYYCNYRVNATVAWGKLYKRECFFKLRFPEGKIHEDEFVIYQILFSCSQITYIKESLYAYYVNAEGIMNSKWNMKRLAIVPALENQLCYFKENKYRNAFEVGVKVYIDCVSNIIGKLKQEQVEEREIRIYRKKLGYFLIRYKKIHNISWKKENYWYYELAFPKIMFYFWCFKGVVHRFVGSGKRK